MTVREESRENQEAVDGGMLPLTIVVNMKHELLGGFEPEKDLAQISKEALSKAGKYHNSLSGWKLTERHGRPLRFEVKLGDSGVMPRETLYLSNGESSGTRNISSTMKRGLSKIAGLLFLHDDSE